MQKKSQQTWLKYKLNLIKSLYSEELFQSRQTSTHKTMLTVRFFKQISDNNSYFEEWVADFRDTIFH